MSRVLNPVGAATVLVALRRELAESPFLLGQLSSSRYSPIPWTARSVSPK